MAIEAEHGRIEIHLDDIVEPVERVAEWIECTALDQQRADRCRLDVGAALCRAHSTRIAVGGAEMLGTSDTPVLDAAVAENVSLV